MSTVPTILDAFPAARSVASIADPADAMQVLEERHLVAVTDDADVRRRFASALRVRLALNHRATVVDVVEDLLAGADDRSAAIEAIPARIGASRDSAKHQYFLWNDVDSLADHHGPALRRTLDAAFAAAAEQEFVSPDTLVIQRHVLLGGLGLAGFAAGRDGEQPPLTEWLTERDPADEDGLTASPRVVIVPLQG